MTLDKVFYSLAIERKLDRCHTLYFSCLILNIGLLWSLIALDLTYIQVSFGVLLSLYLSFIAAYLIQYINVFKELLEVAAHNTASQSFNISLNDIEKRNKSLWQCYIDKKHLLVFIAPNLFVICYMLIKMFLISCLAS